MSEQAGNIRPSCRGAVTAKLLHLPSNSRPDRCAPRKPCALRQLDPGPSIPWVFAPVIALGMAAAMLPWLPLVYLMHINRPE